MYPVKSAPIMTRPLSPLTDEQLMRYSRHIMLPSIDIDGQEAIWNSRVLIIGLGGLGCAASQYLAAAGVGQLTLVDDDVVEKTNLQRQVLHIESQLGLNKTASAKLSLTQINSEISITTIDHRLDNDELTEQIVAHDLVLDCTDNLATRKQLNEVCFATKTPLVSGAAIRFEGQVSTFLMSDNTPCYECVSHIFGEQALTCSEAGILAPVVGMVGTMQATEALKVITQVGQVLSSKLLLIDAATMEFKPFSIPKNPNCRVCSTNNKT
jgi:molybdopterin-synthase adenylyltransferase